MGLGLTVWLEPEHGKKWGIHYPIGFVGQRGRPPLNGEEVGGERDTAQILGQQFLSLEILEPGEDEHQQFSAIEVPGIGVRVGRSQGSVVYELRVPLRESSDHPYALGAGPESTIKLALETGKFEGGGREGGMREGGRGGGRGGFGGRGPGGGGRGGAMPGSERPEPLNFSAVVRLSSASSK